MNFDELETTIGYKFKDKSLLQQALTHRSFAKLHNERLEFLGDSFLNFIIAEILFKQFPNAPEGILTRLRAALVKGETLAEIAKSFKLGDFLQLGQGELRSGGHMRNSILADAMEAIIAAIYLEEGFEVCRQVLMSWFQGRLQDLTPEMKKDPKTALQELLQAKRQPLPDYVLLMISEDANTPEFTVACRVHGLYGEAVGVGSSRRSAEQQAATKMLGKLVENDS